VRPPPDNPAGASLRRLLAEQRPVVAGSCYDCISAAVLEESGFACLTVSGAGVAASHLGVPDLGLVTLPEMLHVARAVSRLVSIPVIADIDTGFGGALNVVRTIEEFAAAGVAAVHLEDQQFPKRCGHIAGKSVVDADEFLRKIRAADRSRQGSELLLIARTDAIAVHGLDDAIERANRALDVGADIAFVEAPTDLEQVEQIATRVEGPCMYNLATGGKSPDLAFTELATLGFALVVVPTVCLYPAIHGMRAATRAVLQAGSDAPLREFGLQPMDLFNLVGMQAWLGTDRSLH
jgi:2-methylisocitrate lyase-like PEP mutase family enzyme